MSKEKLKKIVHNNKALYKILLLIRYVQYKMIWFAKEISSYIRVIGIGNKRYKNIRKFKNIHAGERCFIVATGPSLTYEDLDKIKNEITFGVNSICLSYDKTDFRPTYFGVVDYDVYQKLKDSTDLIRNNNVFVSKKIDKSENRKKDWNVLPIDKYYHWYETLYKNIYTARFSNNASRLLYDSNTVTYIMIQLAAYMGFNEIYLLGVDCNYKQERKRFIDHGHFVEVPGELEMRMTAGFKAAKQYIDKHNGLKIYDCTRGGMLEVFKRKNLEDVLKEKR